MANNTFAISRAQLIYGLCLPLAVLMGYFLAEPLDSGSVAVVVLVLSVLCVPLLMRWHHPLLIVSWNAMITPVFIPGRPYLWMMMAAVSLFFGLLSRATNSNRQFLYVPTVTKALLFLAVVVVATAFMNGGFGVRALGAENFGGKGYFYLLAAIAGYFALTSQPIPTNRAKLYVALFFLSGLTGIMSNLVYMGGSKYWFLYSFLPVEYAVDQAANDAPLTKEFGRLSGVYVAAQAAWCYILARYGLAGIFDFTRPWRLVLLVVALFAVMFGGFRSALILFAVVCVILFCVERLWRTKVLLTVSVAGILAAISLVLFVERLPFTVQRAVSFVPGLTIDPMARQSAEASTEWRLEIWKMVLPDVPKYLFKGKGYSVNPKDLYLTSELASRGLMDSYEVSLLAGDYHNGPLSILIPFGIYGAVGFIWFLVAGFRVLYRNYRFGDPELRQVNAFMLALFAARIVLFLLVFGAIYSDLFYFTGLVGLSVAVNHGVRGPTTEQKIALNLQAVEVF